MASKPINIRCIRTGSQPFWEIMYSIVLQTIFHEYLSKNHKINTSFLTRDFGPMGYQNWFYSYNFLF